MDFPIENGDFPWLCKRLPEGISNWICYTKTKILQSGFVWMISKKKVRNSCNHPKRCLQTQCVSRTWANTSWMDTASWVRCFSAKSLLTFASTPPLKHSNQTKALINGISSQNMAWKMVLTYLHFRILKFPLILPSGKRLHNYGKSHAFSMGKSAISTGPCSIANC